jgi:hypothetical protein
MNRRVLAEVERERGQQDEKWGEQNHADGTGEDYAELAEAARAQCDSAARVGAVTWRHILLEEVCEAAAEADPRKLREELLQVAAVAVAWVEAIDRRTLS